MKAKALLIMVLGLAAAAAAYGAARRWGCGGAAPRDPLAAVQDVSALARKLELTPAQADAVRDIHRQLGADLSACCATHCDARARLAQAVVTNAPEELVEARLDELARAYRDGERRTVDRIRAVRAVLEPEQRTRFDALLTAGCGCGTCCGKPAMPRQEER